MILRDLVSQAKRLGRALTIQEHAGRTNEIQFDETTAPILYRLNGSRPDWVRGDGARIQVGWGRHRSTGGVGMIIGPNPETGSYIEYLQVQSKVVVYIVPPF